MIADRQSDMLAYADDCLEPGKRAGFEALMRAEPDIARQIEQWRGQNEAIRAAFARAREWPAPIRAQASANENADAEWMPQPVKNLRRLNVVRPSPRLVASFAARPAAPRPAERVSPARRGRWLFGALAALAALLGSASGANLTSRPEETLGAGLAAYRTYALGGSTPVEFSTANPRALGVWLAAQLPRATPIPDLSAFGLTLKGGRIVPGARSPAAFVLYETAALARVGLLVEALDAPARTGARVRFDNGLGAAFWTDSAHGFALAGPLDEERLIDLARPLSGN